MMKRKIFAAPRNRVQIFMLAAFLIAAFAGFPRAGFSAAGSSRLYAQSDIFPAPAEGFSNRGAEIKSSLDWDRGILSAEISVNLAAAGIKLPAGRVRAEQILEDEYASLLRLGILSIQTDSSSTVYDLVERGEISLEDIDGLVFGAAKIPPSLSADFSRIIGRYSIPLGRISSVLSGLGTGSIPRPFVSSPAADYTGIIIIAETNLPVHGRNSQALLAPCLSPKIWDTEMNLVFDRTMARPAAASETKALVVYTPPENIFRPTPSGLDGRLAEIAGQNPLRIMGREVYGIVPTDPVIDRKDALLILSSENNRRLLAENRIVIVVNNSMLIKEN